MQRQAPRLLSLYAGLALAFMLLSGGVTAAPAQTPALEGMACIGNALDELEQCLSDMPWYAQLLCELRFEFDVIDCTLYRD